MIATAVSALALPPRILAVPHPLDPADLGLGDRRADAFDAAITRARREWLAIAFLLTFCSHAFTDWLMDYAWPHLPRAWRQRSHGFDYRCVSEIFLIAFGLILVLPTRVRSGLTLGHFRPNAARLFVLFGLPLLLAAIVYPRLPHRAFHNFSMSMWLLGPFGQDLLFGGFLYGKLAPLYPHRLHRRIPIPGAIVVTALFFAAWHLPNFASMRPGFVCFQLAYTFAAALLGGLSRQWTGSILYLTLAHSAANFIAWHAN